VIYMKYGYIYNYNYPTNSSVDGNSTAILIMFIVAIAAAFCIYYAFLKKDNGYKGFTKKLFDFLNFKDLTIEVVLKFVYLAAAIFLTLYSFLLISTSFGAFLFVLVIGNIVLRLSFELILVQILTYKNTKEINDKMKK